MKMTAVPTVAATRQSAAIPEQTICGALPRRRQAPVALLCGALAALIASTALAANPGTARLPVKEVTVFKDGHAFVIHEGKAPTDAAGQVVMDFLPAPVMGTFWPYVAEKNARLASVVASQRRATIERTAITLRELIEANPGAEVTITETNGASYPATILGFPTRTSEELAATSPPNSPERLAEKGNLVLLKSAEGTKALPFDRIQDVTFKQSPRAKAGQEEFRNALTLRLDWSSRNPAKEANVGVVYLQKGIRWVPNYKVDLDGKGKAVVRLQATLLNELVDLDDTTVQLVIGVPTFYFKDTTDPMALQQTLAQLSGFFTGEQGRGRGSVLAGNYFMNNAIMSQSARMGDYRQDGDSGQQGREDKVPESSKNEDLFVFTLKKVTLKKGERAVFPLVEVTVPYEDVFTLELPFAPPTDVRQHFNSQQQTEMAKLFNAPKVIHKARLKNSGTYPFTTAPALVMREGRILAQGMMTYAAPGSSTDLSITTAIDVAVKKSDSETKRTPDAHTLDGNRYMRVDLSGKVRLTNHRAQPVTVEVVRHALGYIDSADNDGKVEMNNVFEGTDYAPAGGGETYPYWWSWYSWPWWWHQVNGVGRATWNVKLEPGKPVELGYAWHYYWR